MAPNLTELCRQVVSIDSSISHGTVDLAKFIVDKSREWGLSAEIHFENFDGSPTANVVIRPGGASAAVKGAKSEFLLCSRLDTADPGDYSYWVRTGANPFKLSVDGEWLYGLGAMDTKADFVCKWLALKNAQDAKKIKGSPVLVGTFGLSSGAGAIRLMRKKLVSPRAALVGGPTKLRLAQKGPGFAKVEVTLPFSKEEQDHHERHNSIEGSYSQSKMFHRQSSDRITQPFLDNPILKLIDYLKNLPNGVSLISVDGGAHTDTEPDSAYLEIDLSNVLTNSVTPSLIRIGESLKKLSAELKSVHDSDCNPGYSTITLGQVRTFPEEIKVSGICRLIPTAQIDLYEAWLEKLRQECAAAGASFRILDYKPPFLGGLGDTFFSFLKGVSSELGLDGSPTAAFGCTEANVFERMGIESFVFGPGEKILDEPVSQERVRLADLEKAQQFYQTVIERNWI